jgi:hypothetical protein
MSNTIDITVNTKSVKRLPILLSLNKCTDSKDPKKFYLNKMALDSRLTYL